MTLDSTLFWQQKWDLWKQAKQFPPLVQRCNYTLSFILGRDNFGWEYADNKNTYSGPKLDLTGATIKLVCEKMPIKPSFPDGARGETWYTTTTIFSVTGTITDAEAGEVEFELDTDDTDAIGRVLAQIQVTDADEKEIVPGHVRIDFTERLG